MTDELVHHEHKRYARYLQQFAEVGEEDELALVETVLDDPDQVMGTSAIGVHVDRRAADLLETPEFGAWADRLGERVADRPFLVKRLAEWRLFDALTRGETGHDAALLEASNWLQVKAASLEAAAVLAEHGRSRQVRAAAADAVRRRAKRR